MNRKGLPGLIVFACDTAAGPQLIYESEKVDYNKAINAWKQGEV